MKKVYPLLFACFLLCTMPAGASIVDIDVVSFQFTPANTTVNVGDIVRFHFNEGFHNATSAGNTLPAGAAQINSGDASSTVRTYDYSVTQPGEYNYYCIVHGGPGGDGMAGRFTANDVTMPVTLAAFSVQAQSNKLPLLTWKTLTQRNVNYFSIQSSTDGLRFKEVGKVTTADNTSGEQQYSFTDKNVTSAFRYVYYRLAIIDLDGKISYSSIEQFKTGFATRKLVVQMAPNPIRRPGQLMLQFNAEKAGLMPVNVFDNNGKLVLSTSMRAMPGLNNGHIHVCDLVDGVYTLQFMYEGLKETRKLVVN